MQGPVNLFCQRCQSRTQHQLTHWQDSGANRPNSQLAVYQCMMCAGLVVALVATNGGTTDECIVYPAVRSAPDALPPDVRDSLNEALAALRVGAWNLSVIGMRTALQMAVRQKCASGSTLKAEIDDLAARHEIPEALAGWAHQVRLDANDATHPKVGLPVAEGDALELLALTESIFEYLYVVPARVEARRERSAV